MELKVTHIQEGGGGGGLEPPHNYIDSCCSSFVTSDQGFPPPSIKGSYFLLWYIAVVTSEPHC